jgi:uncharacterized membrane protein YkvA (DUF1232 family)
LTGESPTSSVSLAERWKARARSLRRDTLALYLASLHPQVPWYAKAVMAVVVAYALSPIDLIPDFIPILGLLDDLILVPLGIALAIRLIPSGVMEECRQKATTLIARPTNWLAAVIIVLVWLGLLALLVWWLVRIFRR